jgi:hypothetical protein
MNTLERGVAFAAPAAQSLLRAGKLDPRWVGAFFALPKAERADESVWTPTFFALRHFVAMYLPLRYWAWARLSGKRNEETEGFLATLIVTIEEALWRGFVDAARLGAPTEGAELVRLVLGPENPLRLGADARADWERRYKASVKGMWSAWPPREAWPRCETMALHVASFYLPLGLSPTLVVERSANASTRRLLDDLVPHVHPDVVQLVGLWLDAATAARDDAGVPVVGWRPATGRRLTGRTETEFLLLGRRVGV